MVFRVPKIKSCCFCASLETGTQIIAGFHLLSFILGAYFPFLIVSSRAVWCKFLQIEVIFRIMIILCYSIEAFVQMIVFESTFLNYGIFALLLTYGTYKKDHKLMFPWILFHTILLLLFCIHFVVDVAYLGLFDLRDFEMNFDMLCCVVQSLTLLTVYNHYRELKEPTTEDV